MSATGAAPAAYGNMLLKVVLTPRQRAGLFAVGVNERYVSLKARLQALTHATRKERRWMTLGPLALGLLALVPWGLRARAGSETSTQSPESSRKDRKRVAHVQTNYNSEQGPLIEDTSQPSVTGVLPGRLIGRDRRVVAGATVYVMPTFWNGKTPIAQTTTDAQGRFRFTRDDIEKSRDTHNFPVVQVIADGGSQGFASCDWSYDRPVHPITLQLPATTTLRTTFLNDEDQPVAGIGVHIGQFRRDDSYWLALPVAMLNRYRGRTDQAGLLTLTSLPQGWRAQPILDDEYVPFSPSGIENRLGGRFAPVARKDAVSLDAAIKRSVIWLLPTTDLQGRISFGANDTPATNTRVTLRLTKDAARKGKRKDFQDSYDEFLRATTDNMGHYQFKGVRPGRYQAWVDPNQRLSNARSWIGSEVTLDLRAEAPTHHDISLTPTSAIKGRVVAAQGGQPIAGQYIGVSTLGGYSYYTTSHKDGTFSVLAPGGKQHLWLQANMISPPKGFVLPTKKEFDLTVPAGGTGFVTLRLPRAVPERAPQPIRGLVVDENGQPVAAAQVSVEGLDNPAPQGRATPGLGVQGLRTDARGRFTLVPRLRASAVQLWATAGERGTLRGTFALSGDSVTLHLRPNPGVTFEGRITDADGKPVEGLTLRLYRCYNNSGYPSGSTQTDKDGRYAFEGQRTNMVYMIRPQGPGFFGSGSSLATQAGQHLTVDIQAERADSFIAGQLLNENGEPAPGYEVWATGASRSVTTDIGGRFRVPHTKRGTLHLTAYSPDLTNDFQVQAGRSDLVLRLSRTQNGALSYRPDPTRKTRLQNLVGKPAPDLAVRDWTNSAPLSIGALRGKVVVLDFFGASSLYMATLPELSAIRDQFAGRGVQVVGIAQLSTNSSYQLNPVQLRVRLQSSGVTYPVAVDAPGTAPAKLATSGRTTPVGVTTQRYQEASLVVINPQGRVAYAGHSLLQAINTVAGLIK